MTQPSDSGSQKLDKLVAILGGSAETKIEAAALLADLLSIPFGDRYPALQLTEVVKKQRTMEVLEEQLVLLSRRAPVLVLFEDTHWIDPTSIELIGRTVRTVVDLPEMMIVTHRPEFSRTMSRGGHRSRTAAGSEVLGAESRRGARQIMGTSRATRTSARCPPAALRGFHRRPRFR